MVKLKFGDLVRYNGPIQSFEDGFSNLKGDLGIVVEVLPITPEDDLNVQVVWQKDTENYQYINEDDLIKETNNGHNNYTSSIGDLGHHTCH